MKNIIQKVAIHIMWYKDTFNNKNKTYMKKYQ